MPEEGHRDWTAPLAGAEVNVTVGAIVDGGGAGCVGSWNVADCGGANINLWVTIFHP
jgi:hypothetical protein